MGQGRLLGLTAKCFRNYTQHLKQGSFSEWSTPFFMAEDEVMTSSQTLGTRPQVTQIDWSSFTPLP